MTQKSRYFLVGSAVVLLLGVGGGLIAYLNYQRASGLPAGVPPEVRYVPANAAIVAYANVRVFMSSELRRELMPTIEMGSRKGRQMMNDFAGIDLEKQVDHVLAYVEPRSHRLSPTLISTPKRSDVRAGYVRSGAESSSSSAITGASSRPTTAIRSPCIRQGTKRAPWDSCGPT